MARKTYYMEQDGIRSNGHATKTDARKAWAAIRDDFAKRSAECGVWTFAIEGYVCIVSPLPEGWQYWVITPKRRGVIGAACYYNAPSQVHAICSALGALAQSMWTREIIDDGEWFDNLAKLARIHPNEIAEERANFVHVTEFWRSHPVAA